MVGCLMAATVHAEIIAAKVTVILIPIGFICLGQLYCSLDYCLQGSTLESTQAPQRASGSQLVALPVQCVTVSYSLHPTRVINELVDNKRHNWLFFSLTSCDIQFICSGFEISAFDNTMVVNGVGFNVCVVLKKFSKFKSNISLHTQAYIYSGEHTDKTRAWSQRDA